MRNQSVGAVFVHLKNKIPFAFLLQCASQADYQNSLSPYRKLAQVSKSLNQNASTKAICLIEIN